MSRIRRRGYIVEWFAGDHVPRHIHVFDAHGRFLGRLDVDRLAGVEGWVPERRLLRLVEELRSEGLL